MLNLKAIRTRSGLSVAQVSERLGVKPDTYRKWESEANAIPLARAWQCADLLGCSLDELAGREKAVLSPDESELVACYRDTDERGRVTILDTARRERGAGGVREGAGGAAGLPPGGGRQVGAA